MKARLLIALMLILGVFYSIPAYSADNSTNIDPSPTLKIVGGDDCTIEEYPWQIAIFGIDNEGNITQQMCGGSIIDPYWILTAAHCVNVKSNKTQKIVCEITKLSGAEQGQIIEIADFIVHEGYDPDALTNDIALLRLSQPIDTSKLGSKVIRMITPAEETAGLIAPGITATITGWGTTQYMGDSPDNLQVGTLPIIPIDTANKWFAETNSGVPQVTAGMLPSGFVEGGVSACHGDSGGLMVVKDANGNWILVGVTSWGNVCAGPKRPAIYTRVPYYYDWIMNKSGLNDPKTPTEPDLVEIVKLDIPSKVFICDDVANFGEVLIQNFGTNDLEIFELTVKVGKSADEILASESKMIVLTEKLKPLGAKRIDITPVLPDTLGVYYIEVSVAKPNLQDVAIEKNKLESTLNYVDPTPLKMKLNMQTVGELAWAILELPSFTVIESGSYNSQNSNSTKFENICLVDGTYAITFNSEGTSFDYSLAFDYEGTEYVFAEGDENYNPWLPFTVPFIPISDLAVNVSTEINSDSIYICSVNDLNMLPTVEIRNLGTIPANDIKVRYIINGTINDTTFSGKIFSDNSYYLNIDPTGFNLGPNSVKVEILDYKELDNDANLANNLFEINFSVLLTEQSAVVEINPDNNYYAHSFTIENSSNEVIYQHSFSQLSKYKINLCLPEGCYYFNPESWYGEIDKDTAVVVKSMNGTKLLAVKGEDFNAQNSYQFCISNTGVNDDILQDEIIVYPNPASKHIGLIVPAIAATSAIVDITDLLGNRLATWDYNLNYGQNHLNIDVAGFNTGIYNLRIIAGNSVVTKRIVIQK